MDSSMLLKAWINEQQIQLLTYNFYLLAIKMWLNSTQNMQYFVD